MTITGGPFQATEANPCVSGIWQGKVATKISKVRTFWKAEAEDQNYLQLYRDGKDKFNPSPSTAGQLRTHLRDRHPTYVLAGFAGRTGSIRRRFHCRTT